MTEASPPTRLALLDAMRGIAAVAVMVYHAHHLGLLPKLMGRGYLFVEFFFLLGGFAFAMGAEGKLRSGAVRGGAFLWSRFRRLWPVLALGVAVGLAQFALDGQLGQGLAYAPAALLLIPAFWIAGPALFPLNGPHWYLSWEMIANAANALVLRRLSNRWLAVIVIAMGAWLAGAIYAFGSNEFGMVEGRWLPGLPRAFFSVGAGLILGRLLRDRALPRGLRLPWPVALAAPLLMLASLPWWGLRVWQGDILVVLFAMPLLFACAANTALPARWTPLAVLSGRLSYPLYALHLPILIMAARHLPASIAPLAGLAGGIGAAALVAATIERR